MTPFEIITLVLLGILAAAFIYLLIYVRQGSKYVFVTVIAALLMANNIFNFTTTFMTYDLQEK